MGAVAQTDRVDDLAALEARVRHDLEILDFPRERWLPKRAHPAGHHVHDVAIVGAGQSGLAIAFALRREKVDNVIILDRRPKGQEGPWVTYARMPVLRTPKYLVGPDLGIASLSFRAWFEAQPKLGRWDDVVRIPRRTWMDYLCWYRKVLELEVANQCEVQALLGSANDCIELQVRREGRAESLFARKVVLATGMEGAGGWWIPEPIVQALPRRLYAHTADSIDFGKLRGKRVGVLGVGASAVDNAAQALAEGAARVDVFCRRRELPKSEARGWIEHNGFLRHFFELDDTRRWKIMRRFWETGAPAPQWSLEAAAAYPGFHLHLASPWNRISHDGDVVVIETPHGTHQFDFVIAATGLIVDLRRQPELAAIADKIATWGDRFIPPPGEACEPLALCPYLGRGYELTERTPGTAPYLRNIHLFNWGATPSNGISASSITGMKFGVPRVVAGITRGLYFDTADEHAAAFPWDESRSE